MTTPVPLKAGEVLVPISGSAWAERWSEIKLINSHRFKNTTYWWVEMTDKSGMVHIDTMNLGSLRTAWQRKATFFKIGKTYRMSTNKFVISDTYRVIEIAHVDDPLTPNEDVIALAIGKDAMSGKQYGTSLNRSDFSKMVEA